MIDFSWLLDKPIAHRGFWGQGEGDQPFCAENSLTAYQRAIDKGYNIEIDVHLMKDDDFAVFHDGTTTRVCGVKAKVKDMTKADLKNYHLSNTQDTIPTLREVLDLVDGKVGLLIEMKDFTNKNDCCKKLYDYLKDYKGKYAIQSFNITVGGGALGWWRKNTEGVPIGILSCRPLHLMLPSWKDVIKPDFYAFDIKGLPVKYIEKERRTEGVKLLSWTIRTQEAFDKATKKVKVDNIIFDTYRLKE